MKYRSIVVTLLLCCLALPGIAQDVRPTSKPLPEDHPLLKPLPKIVMKDVLLKDVLFFINKDEAFNVVIAENVDEIRIPSIQGQNMSILSILSLLESTAPALEIQLFHRGAQVDVDKASRYLAQADTHSGDWIILCKVRASKADGESLAVQRAVYAVGPLLSEESMKVEDLASAIELAWESVSSVEPPKVQFHEDTRLFFCSASSEHIDVADQVIAQLPGGAEVLQRSLASRQATPANEDKLKQLESALELNLEDIAQRMQLESIQSQSRRELNERDRRIGELESQRARLQGVLERREAEIFEMRKLLQAKD